MVGNVARRVTGDDQTAREVMQDTFVHLWEHADRVDLTRGTLRAYLSVVAHHRAVDAVRAGARRRRAEAAAFDLTVVSTVFEDDVTTAGARSWCRERLDAALDALPAEQRDAIILAYFGQKTYKDVAVALDIPEGTAKSRIRLGLARVRESVGDDLLAER
jgi:RNA polymerase sigma-70 factor (ECF subfamily)